MEGEENEVNATWLKEKDMQEAFNALLDAQTLLEGFFEFEEYSRFDAFLKVSEDLINQLG